MMGSWWEVNQIGQMLQFQQHLPSTHVMCRVHYDVIYHLETWGVDSPDILVGVILVSQVSCKIVLLFEIDIPDRYSRSISHAKVSKTAQFQKDSSQTNAKLSFRTGEFSSV